MAHSTILPLALLYTQGRDSVDGATRFQKLIFIAQQEGSVPERYSYHADKFGPFSPQLHADLNELAGRGLLEKNERRNEVGNTKYVYSITPEGIQKVRKVLQKGGAMSTLFEELQDIKHRYNEYPLQDLLRYVYKQYPDYATESELDTSRLFDPDTRSQFLEPDSEKEFIGTEPGEWKDVNSSAEDIFSI
jgi:uncharacterized protein YwgA